MINWHGPDGGLETWIRSEMLDSSLVEEALKTAERESLEQVVSEGQQMFNIYLTCKSFEVALKQLILQGGEAASAAMNFEVSKVRNLFAIKHYDHKSVNEHNAEDMYGRWLRVICDGNGSAAMSGECQTEKLGGKPSKDHELGSKKIFGKASRAEQAEEVREGEEEEKDRKRRREKEKEKEK